MATCEKLIICPGSSRGARHIGTSPQGQGHDEEEKEEHLDETLDQNPFSPEL